MRGVEGGEEEGGEEEGGEEEGGEEEEEEGEEAGSRRQRQLMLLQIFMLPLGQLCWWEARDPFLLPANHHTGRFDM